MLGGRWVPVIPPPMANHAGFVGRIQMWEMIPALMAGAALLAHRKGGIVAARRILGLELIVRVVAVDTVRIVLA
jgi:hypothetical protein